MSNTKNSILGRILEALNKKLDVDYKETYQEITNARTFSFSKITDEEENTKICLKNTECKFPILNKSGKDTTSLGIDFKNKQDKLMGGFYRNDVIKDDIKKQEILMSCVSGNDKKTFLGVGFEGENAEKEVVITTPEIKNNIVSWIMPNFDARIEMPCNVKHTIPSLGWVLFHTLNFVTNMEGCINGIYVYKQCGMAGHWQEYNSLLFPVKTGDTVECKGHTLDQKVIFFPFSL